MSSLAAIVRAIKAATDEGEEFDLAGSFTEAQARDLVRQAFTDPLPHASKPLKFTFIVGGGKLVRARYDVELPKWLMGELRALGFDDDRGASLGSEGACKRQHDTDQNLEYLHVFPRLAKSAASSAPAGHAGGGGAVAAAAAAAAVDQASPEYVCVACSLEQFQRLVASRVVPYAGKKRLLAALQAWDARLAAWDAAMMATARPLSAAEQETYDVTTREALGEKVAWLQGEMKAQVAAGRLTGLEKERVLAGMDEKLAAARAEQAAAAAAGAAGAKRAAALAASVDALAARRSALAACAPGVHALRGDVEMRKAQVGIANGERLKAKLAKEGRLATLAEARELGAKLDCEARLAELQAAARTWFEDDAEFDARFAAAMRALQARAAPGGGRR